jgi:hypothetical protein
MLQTTNRLEMQPLISDYLSPHVFVIFVLAVCLLEIIARWGLHRTYFFCRLRRWRWKKSRTASGVILSIARDVGGEVSRTLNLSAIEREVWRMESRFRQSVGRLRIIVLPNSQAVRELFGAPIGGAAFLWPTTVVIGEGVEFWKTLRHEVAHLLAAKWNPFAPALLAEGLCTWLESTAQRAVLDRVALKYPPEGLKKLLHPRYFASGENRILCSAAAASFSGFLMRRFGCTAYERLYRASCRRRFEGIFQHQLGMRLDEAERQWRRELVARYTITALWTCS